MNALIKPAILLFLALAPINILAQSDSALKIPFEVKPFIEKDTAVIALESADLNGDGAADFILVTENAAQVESNDAGDTDDADDADEERDERRLLILVRSAGGKLTEVKHNEKVVYCRSCGGAFGDPFAGVTARRGGFTVNNYGGSAWRWSESYEFNYSRRDATWQLVRVLSETFNALEPKKVKRKIRVPKNFGKIDINDFDPAALR